MSAYDPRQQQPYPPQQPGQQYQQQPYGQQQPYAQQQPGWSPQQYPQQGAPWGGPPQGPGQPRRKRHIVRNVFAGIGAVIVVIVVIAVAASSGSGGHTVTGSSTPTASAAANGKAPAKAAPAGVGSAIVLTGNSAGEKMTVTVTKVFAHATGAGQFDTPSAGDRFYAVQFRLADTGSAAYSDAPSNGAAVVDSLGQAYQSDPMDDVSQCDSFGGTENIAAGASGLGCIVFDVPVKAKITRVQFTLDSGLGPQTGQWEVAR
jgi:nitrogen fixation protein FixH